MTHYVVGFLFKRLGDGLFVALIRKAKPAWQKGKLNGVGGKIEEGETPYQAMVREFREETGQTVTDRDDWKEFCVLRVPDAKIHFFVAYTPTLLDFECEPGEEVYWLNVENVKNCDPLPNLSWLIPLALDADTYAAADSLRDRRQ